MKYIDLSTVVIETNSPLWQVIVSQDEHIIQVTGNTEEDHRGGKVALIGDTRKNYSMQVDLKFLGHYLPERAGWFGIVMRAHDVKNYELVWFMPEAENKKTAAYISVAHGIVPWWTEAYATQEKGCPHIPRNTWFTVRVDVVDDEMTLYIEDKIVFTKKLTYYLSEGRPGLYVGTATDAAFRRIVLTTMD